MAPDWILDADIYRLEKQIADEWDRDRIRKLQELLQSKMKQRARLRGEPVPERLFLARATLQERVTASA